MYPSRLARVRGKLTPRFRTRTGIGTKRPAKQGERARLALLRMHNLDLVRSEDAGELAHGVEIDLTEAMGIAQWVRPRPRAFSAQTGLGRVATMTS